MTNLLVTEMKPASRIRVTISAPLKLTRYRGGAPGLAILVLVAFAVILGPVVYGRSPVAQDYSAILHGPSWAHPLGTDDIGRDQLARILAGGRVTLRISVIAVLVSGPIGAMLGTCAGYWRGFGANVLSTALDSLLAFPVIVLALSVTAALGPGVNTLVIAFSVVQIPVFARVARGEALSLRERTYVEAARSIGASDLRIMVNHVLRNMVAPLIVQGTLAVSFVILAEAGLSFLGVGVQPPQAAWGSMLRRSMPYLEQAPWLVFGPGAAIFIAVLGLNLFGDSLREALDPRAKGGARGGAS